MSRLIYWLALSVIVISSSFINLNCASGPGVTVSQETKPSGSDATEKPTSNSSISVRGSIFYLVTDSEVAKKTYNEIAKQNTLEGFGISGIEYYQSGTQDFGSVVSQVKNQNIDIVWVIGNKEDKVSIESELNKLGIKAQIGFTQIGSKSVARNATNVAFLSSQNGDVEIRTIGTDGADDKKIAHLSGAGGEFQPGYLTISPDGNKMALINFQSFLQIIPVDGGKQISIAKVDPGYSWSHDGIQIVFSSYSRGEPNDIYRVDADGTNLVKLKSDGNSKVFPAWSPTDDRISFNIDGKPYTIYSNGNGIKQLVNIPSLAFQWSPDGNKIYCIGRPFGEQSVFTVNPNNGEIVILTKGLYSYSGWFSLTQDGTKLAFVGMANDNEYDIYTINSDGSDLKRLTNDEVFKSFASLSNDGTKIIFEAVYDRVQYICIMNTNSSNIVRLAKGYSPAWLPIMK
jgi:Tol biopolymer transport system component